jgi:hypothetical protein
MRHPKIAFRASPFAAGYGSRTPASPTATCLLGAPVELHFNARQLLAAGQELRGGLVAAADEMREGGVR